MSNKDKELFKEFVDRTVRQVIKEIYDRTNVSDLYKNCVLTSHIDHDKSVVTFVLMNRVGKELLRGKVDIDMYQEGYWLPIEETLTPKKLPQDFLNVLYNEFEKLGMGR